MKPGDKVISHKLGPGVWEVLDVFEYNARVTLDGITHIRPTEWFKVVEASKGDNSHDSSTEP